MDETNKESWLINCDVINWKIPFSSEIKPLLFEKETVEKGIGDKVRESLTWTVIDCALIPQYAVNINKIIIFFIK